jgi:putative FmdB family regulatory protein
MPFYEYQCQACGQHHEAMQKMSEAPLRKCPHCGKPKLKRLISAPVFRLKGSGWYETDFKSDQEKKRNLHGEVAKADAGDAKPAAPAKADGKAETQADGKAEPKAEPKAEAKPAPTAASKSAAKPRSRTARPAAKRARRR